MTDYPTLDSFIGGYLHLDWHDDYPDIWAALDGFLADGPPVNAETLRAEIAVLLAEHPVEEDVRRIVLDDLGCCCLVEVFGWTYRDWLEAVSDHATKTVGHPLDGRG